MNQTSLETRFEAYCRQEKYVWIAVRGDPRVMFGWVLSCRENALVVKDDEYRRPVKLAWTDVESCGEV